MRSLCHDELWRQWWKSLQKVVILVGEEVQMQRRTAPWRRLEVLEEESQFRLEQMVLSDAADALQRLADAFAFERMLPRPFELQTAVVRRESEDVAHHLPRSLFLRPKRAVGDFTVVLPKSPLRVDREADVRVPFVIRVCRCEQITSNHPRGTFFIATTGNKINRLKMMGIKVG